MTLEEVEQKLTEHVRIHKARLARVEKLYLDKPTQESLIECTKLKQFICGVKYSVGIVAALREQPLPFNQEEALPSE